MAICIDFAGITVYAEEAVRTGKGIAASFEI